MECDTRARGWPTRAACRWLAYSVLWTITVAVCLFSSYHVALRAAGALLGCLLAASLPLLAATLFENTYAKRARRDLPILCCPWIGSVTILLGALAFVQASALILWTLSSTNLESAQDLCKHFAGMHRAELPRTVCVQRAFIKTEWEAGKLRCEDSDGHVHCEPEFVAAPIFNDKALSDHGLADSIWAWAVTHGRHVDANYRPDGTLCGYLSGHADFDFYIGDYRLAVQRAIKKNHLLLSTHVTDAAHIVAPADSTGPWQRVPLEARPVFMTEDPSEVSHVQQAWLLAGMFLLCLCPCTGPVPIGAFMLWLCWARNDQQEQGRPLSYRESSGMVAPYQQHRDAFA